MDNLTITKSAQQYFENEEYLCAIDSLAKLGVEEFVLFASKKKWFTNAKFCSSFLEKESLFVTILSSDSSDELLFDYFKKSVFLPDFEQKLAELLPNHFIHSVRVSRSFLDVERLNFYSSLELPDELLIHKIVWNNLQARESLIWNEIEAFTLDIIDSKISLEKVLSEAIVWIEESRFQNNNNAHLYHLAQVYNFFIKLYLHRYSEQKDLIISDFDGFSRVFAKTLSESSNSKISVLLNKISCWVSFRDSILDPYCFDTTISLVDINGIINFKRSAFDYYKWELDAIRYNLNSLEYYALGADCVQYLIKHKNIKIPEGSVSGDEDGNIQLAIQKEQLMFFLNDLKIENLVLGGKLIATEKLAVPLLAYSKNRSLRYEEKLQFYMKISKTWKDALCCLFRDAINLEIDIFPFFLMTRQAYVDLNNKAIDNFSKDFADDIVKLFSYEINSKFKFNRFNIDYNVWEKPFMILGDILFCPIIFIANNDWFYAFTQAGLENLNKKFSVVERKKTATAMENQLGELMKGKGWQIKVIDDREASHLAGDVDVIAYDQDVSLLIQLKRTKFRLDLEGAYNESIIIDRKASKQLNDVENYLLKENEIFNLKGKVVKWIVTTSYEGVLNNINSCIKINYFDLIRAVLNPSITKLNELITYIENDEGLKKHLQPSKSTTNNDVLLPLPLDNFERYNQRIFLINNNGIVFNYYYDKALMLSERGKKEKAIKILTNYSYYVPNDVYVWSALGNIYADIKEFKNSLECFEKALEILPNDPFLLRKLAFTYRDNGDSEKGMMLYYETTNKYWFLDLK